MRGGRAAGGRSIEDGESIEYTRRLIESEPLYLCFRYQCQRFLRHTQARSDRPTQRDANKRGARSLCKRSKEIRVCARRGLLLLCFGFEWSRHLFFPLLTTPHNSARIWRLSRGAPEQSAPAVLHGRRPPPQRHAAPDGCGQGPSRPSCTAVQYPRRPHPPSQSPSLHTISANSRYISAPSSVQRRKGHPRAPTGSSPFRRRPAAPAPPPIVMCWDKHRH